MTISWQDIIKAHGFKPSKGMRIGIDIDKTLTLKSAWNKEQATECKPDKVFVDLCWSIHNDTKYLPTVILTTARRTKLSRETIEWLERNNLPFPIIFRKHPLDIYFGDECINAQAVRKQAAGKRFLH